MAVLFLVPIMAGCRGATPGPGSGPASTGAAGIVTADRYPAEDICRSYLAQAVEYGKKREKYGKILAKARPEAYADNERVYELYSTGKDNLLKAVREAYADVCVPASEALREIEARIPAGSVPAGEDAKAVAWLSWLLKEWDKPGAVPPETPAAYRSAFPARRKI